MSATNSILPFAQGGGANVQTQAAYAADAQRPTGNQPGVARADFNNKALLQSSVIAAGVAQFLADWQGTNVDDTLSAAAISAMLMQAVSSAGALRTVNANTTLTLADTGKVILGGSATPITVTLPAANSVKAGALLHFENGQAGLMTVARAGTDTISSTPSTVTSLAIGQGDSAVLRSDGVGNWYLVGGSTALASATSFANSLGTGASGFHKFPTGYIQQWATATSDASGVATITYPLAFPSNLLGGQVSLFGAGNNVVANIISATTTVATVNTRVGNTGATAPAMQVSLLVWGK